MSGHVVTRQVRVEGLSMKAIHALMDAYAQEKNVPDHVKPNVEIQQNGEVVMFQWVWVD